MFDEVLPQIRQTGGYIPVSEEDDEKTILSRAVLISQKTIAQKDKIINKLKPKADQYDHFLSARGTYSMNQVGKMLGVGEYTLFERLRAAKILFYECEDNVPYERYKKNNCFKVIATIDPKGNPHSTTRVTPKGVSLICKRLNLVVLNKEVSA